MVQPTPASSPSLTLRLLAFAAASIALALAAAWLVLGYLFERHSERQLQAALERDAIALMAAIQVAPDGGSSFILQRLPSDSRYSRPASGLYWQVSQGAESQRSRSLWDGQLPYHATASTASRASWHYHYGKGPFEPEVLLASRVVHRASAAQPFTILVAADSQELRTAAAHFGRESAIFLGLLWLALSAAAWAQVRLGLKPLQSLRTHITAMSRSAEGRLPHQDLPREISPLTEAINHLAERRSQDIVKARQRAQDLAHALKTPITALRLQMESLPPQQAQEMEQSLALLRGAVEAELARTSISDGTAASAPAPLADRLIAVIRRTPDGRALHFINQLPAELTVPLSLEALSEMLGAALENAARHARTTVRIDGGSDDHIRWLRIGDDGDGVSEKDRTAVLARGVRLDERGPHQGLGLAIIHDSITASGGTLALQQSDLGGLELVARWPVDLLS